MQNQLFVYGFINGANRIVMAAPNIEDATSQAFEICTMDSLTPMTFSELDWGKQVMLGHSTVRH